MAKEIERKYLVIDQKYRDVASAAIDIKQGYLNRDPLRTIRVRTCGNNGFITVKGPNSGISHDEWEFPIDLKDAGEMLGKLCDGTVLSKTRYIVPFGNNIWEIDEFHGDLEGLVVAEVELSDETCIISELPDFIGREVSDDVRYYNSSLAGGVIPPFE
ncbi:MAG: CYTH domain-containing protein [Muribaculaceae bacterium]|nr:CYTH domain-containing protein [Muribaculaceae bacterium]